MKKTCILIPTYNEAGNIEKLLNKIYSLGLPNIDTLIIDDNSPDGTAEIVERLMTENVSIKILNRKEKNGLGRAYIDGFKLAIEKRYDYIFEMDADLSHDPSYIPKFLKEIESHDLILGSRYIPQGGVSNWGKIRLFISKLGNLYARIILRVNYRDLTGGFKCYRREVLESIDLDKIDSIGYIFQVETTLKTHRAGFKIKEIPIIFQERYQGNSKFSLKIILESFWKILSLAIKKSR